MLSTATLPIPFCYGYLTDFVLLRLPYRFRIDTATLPIPFAAATHARANRTDFTKSKKTTGKFS
ncbi:hypothetical protein LJC08_02770 [Methanimicrococcus sp. OttesenSCG-928-J09]|nr:hypothetical protein [Methanimicrococcus sp. OttesenSCG-928-J09]